MIIELAHQLGKEVFYVNSMISFCSESGTNQKIYEQTIKILSKCSFVSVRDLESLRILSKLNIDTEYKYIPDALFTWFKYFDGTQTNILENGDFLITFPEKDEYFGKIDFSQPYICVSGSSLAAWEPEKAVPYYIELVKAVKHTGIQVILAQACTGDSFLKEVSSCTNTPIVPVETPILLVANILANAQLFISGRYHPSIMASLGGTPCIFLGSNSHKTRSLQEVLEYEHVLEFSAYPSSDECVQIAEQAKSILIGGNTRLYKIKKVVSKLSEEAQTLVNFIK